MMNRGQIETDLIQQASLGKPETPLNNMFPVTWTIYSSHQIDKLHT